MNTVVIQKSHKKDKKYDAVINGSKTVPFGQAGYSDFTIHKDEERKLRYLNRHKGMGEHWNDPETAGFYARWLLWNKTSLAKSIEDMNIRFKNYHFFLRL